MGFGCREARPPAGARRGLRATTHGRRDAASPATADRGTGARRQPSRSAAKRRAVSRERKRSIACNGDVAHEFAIACGGCASRDFAVACSWGVAPPSWGPGESQRAPGPRPPSRVVRRGSRGLTIKAAPGPRRRVDCGPLSPATLAAAPRQSNAPEERGPTRARGCARGRAHARPARWSARCRRCATDPKSC